MSMNYQLSLYGQVEVKLRKLFPDVVPVRCIIDRFKCFTAALSGKDLLPPCGVSTNTITR